MGEIKITLPLPPKCLHPNKILASSMWTVKREKRKTRLNANMLTRKQLGGSKPRFDEADVYCNFYFNCKRNRDMDNLLAWMKASFDGMADAGIVKDDYGFRHHPPEQFVDKDNPRVEIVIKERPQCFH